MSAVRERQPFTNIEPKRMCSVPGPARYDAHGWCSCGQLRTHLCTCNLSFLVAPILHFRYIRSSILTGVLGRSIHARTRVLDCSSVQDSG